MIDLLKKHQNVYTDISIQPAEHIKTLINEIGYGRILFGTDYPFVTQAFSRREKRRTSRGSPGIYSNKRNDNSQIVEKEQKRIAWQSPFRKSVLLHYEQRQGTIIHTPAMEGSA